MGTLTLRLALGAGAFLFASAAPAQMDPRLERAASQLDQSLAPRPNWTDVAVRDAAGNAVIIAYSDGRPGFRQVEFRDADGRLITVLGRRGPMAPTSAGEGQNPVQGNPLPPLVELQPPVRGYIASGGSEMTYLMEQIKHLKEQVKLLTDRVNAR